MLKLHPGLSFKNKQNRFPKNAFLKEALTCRLELISPLLFIILVGNQGFSSLTAELKDFIGGNFFVAPQIELASVSICPVAQPF